MVKTILFDLGLTLAENDIPQQHQSYLEQHGHFLSLEEVEKAYHLTNKYYMRELPGVLGQPREVYLADYTKMLCNFLHIPHMGENLYQAALQRNSSIWRCFPFTRDTLQELHAMGIRTGLITNWDSSCRNLLHNLELDTLLNPILVSSEEGMEKPNSLLFQKALSMSRTAPEETLYVGDNYYDDAVGANSVGMDCYVINKYGTLGIEELKGITIIKDIRELPQRIKTINL